MKKINEVQQLRNLMEMWGDERNRHSPSDTSPDIEQIDKIDQWCMDNMNQSRASKWNMEAENTLDRYEVEYWTDLERENENAISALIDYAYELGIIDRDLNEEEESGPVVYEDMASDGGEYVAFEDDWAYSVYIDALEAEGEGSAYGGADGAFELVSDIPALKVVPNRLIKNLDTALELEDMDIVEELVDDVNRYYFDTADLNNAAG